MTHNGAYEHHDHPAHMETSKKCRLCSIPYLPENNPSFLGICSTCGYKILIVLLVIMIATSYIAWFGVL